jgi:hypothetical protein
MAIEGELLRKSANIFHKFSLVHRNGGQDCGVFTRSIRTGGWSGCVDGWRILKRRSRTTA